jgi:hypothetical protein
MWFTVVEKHALICRPVGVRLYETRSRPPENDPSNPQAHRQTGRTHTEPLTLTVVRRFLARMRRSSSNGRHSTLSGRSLYAITTAFGLPLKPRCILAQRRAATIQARESNQTPSSLARAESASCSRSSARAAEV